MARIRALLEARAGGSSSRDGCCGGASNAAIDERSPIGRIQAGFELSPFERDLLLLCAAVEFDPSIGPLCAAAQADSRMPHPTFRLALDVLPGPHWSALLPEAPLRRWKLIEVGAGGPLTTSPLRIDECVLHFLAGLQSRDERLRTLLDPVDLPNALPGSYRLYADRIVGLWRRARDVVVQLQGDAIHGKRALAAAACAALGMRLHRLRAADVPLAAPERDTLAHLWEREAVMTGSALLLDAEGAQPAHWEAICALVDRLQTPLLVSGSGPLELARDVVAIVVDKPRSEERRALWEAALRGHAGPLDGALDRVADQFVLEAAGIEVAGRRAVEAIHEGATDAFRAVWDACRAQAGRALEERAQRIDACARWEDLVVPAAAAETLRAIAAQVRHRGRVLNRWGFGAHGTRGLGVTALFTGPSGTGKTLAAEVLANELQLDLYRIDLSQVVSKYVGETEKNLRAVFDAAENGGAVLLFDEADALFGKRSEVKDSHDRYANVEVGYLLQRMEDFGGLAILTTNMRGSLDAAFLRRIRFV
ncbi:MAG TPA: ATP-binding protein, partial [Solirubrobacter sp.]